MRILFSCLIVLPLAFAMPHERFLLDSFLDTSQMTTFLTQLSCTLGTDTNEQTCETKCHTVIKSDHLLQYSCPLICKSFQSLVHRFGVQQNAQACPEITTQPEPEITHGHHGPSEPTTPPAF